MSGSGGGTAREPHRAVVIGGGIAGLSAAFDLRRAGWAVELHEAADRFGGKIHSSPVGDRLVDAGPDTFLARVEPGRVLCRDLGLDDELTSPVAPVPAYLVRDGSLHQLPPGSMLGVPTDLDALADSPLVSDAGTARAARDLDVVDAGGTANAEGDDVSVGSVCRAHLGDEVTDRLIDPLLGGINASDIDRLSLKAGAPLLAAALGRSPSLIAGLRLLRPSSGPTLGTAGDDPVFFGLPGGIARIIDALVAALTDPGADGPVADLYRNSPVASLADVGHGTGAADAVVVATPAFVAARLLADASPDAAGLLATIDHASVAQVTVELPLDAIDRELDASGILFPRVEGTLITASTWFSTKWAHYRRPGTVLIRLTSGRFGDDRPGTLDDDTLATTLLGELSEVVPITGAPTAVRVQRWPSAFPQYTPGHGRRVDDLLAAVATDSPDVVLAGAAYRGIGIPACIDSGRSAARKVIERWS